MAQLSPQDIENMEKKGQMVPESRGFVLTRSFYAGSHAIGSMWTGDNAALYTHIKGQIAMGLSLSASGYSLTGSDLGGFFISADFNCEMLLRFFQAGLGHTFFRHHSLLNNPLAEAFRWLDDDLSASSQECGAELRRLLKHRVLLSPHLFSTSVYYHLTGTPIQHAVHEYSPDFQRDTYIDGYLSGGLRFFTGVETSSRSPLKVNLTHVNNVILKTLTSSINQNHVHIQIPVVEYTGNYIFSEIMSKKQIVT